MFNWDIFTVTAEPSAGYRPPCQPQKIMSSFTAVWSRVRIHIANVCYFYGTPNNHLLDTKAMTSKTLFMVEKKIPGWPVPSTITQAVHIEFGLKAYKFSIISNVYQNR